MEKVNPNQTLSLTEIHQDEQNPPLSTLSNMSGTSETSTTSKNSTISNMTNTTASITSNKSGDHHQDFADQEVSDTAALVAKNSPPEVRTTVSLVSVPSSTNITPVTMPILTLASDKVNAGNLEVSVLIPPSPNLDGVPQNISMETLPESAPTSSSTSSMSTNLDSIKIRKVSPISQNGGKDTPKREVYV